MKLLQEVNITAIRISSIPLLMIFIFPLLIKFTAKRPTVCVTGGADGKTFKRSRAKLGKLRCEFWGDRPRPVHAVLGALLTFATLAF